MGICNFERSELKKTYAKNQQKMPKREVTPIFNNSNFDTPRFSSSEKGKGKQNEEIGQSNTNPVDLMGDILEKS